VLNSSVPYYFGLGDLLREWNRLDEAERLLLQGMELFSGARSIFADDVWQGYLALARLYQARGEFRQAGAALDTFARLAEARHFIPHLSAQAAAAQAQLDLAQGNLAAAINWADECGLPPNESDLSYPHEREYLILVRVRIVQARNDPAGPMLRDVVRLLDNLLGAAEAKARLGSALEILIVQALALSTQGDRKRALAALERALAHAAPEGYIRLFVDEGEPMLALLRQAQAHGIAPDFVATLLSAFGEPVLVAPQQSRPTEAWVEPLTEREREVLHLLATGASNGEIARRLVVSVGTIKKHVSNICGKLGVQSRTQALLRARTLHLL
jgi:LuxR family transcriptional regulator, maltose regulon positive regulatory protein